MSKRLSSPAAVAELKALMDRVYPGRNLTQQEQALAKMAELQSEIDRLKAENQALRAENEQLRSQAQARPAPTPAPRAAPAPAPTRVPDEEDASSARFRLLELD